MEKNEFQQLTEKISNGTATEKEVALYNYYYTKLQKETWKNKYQDDMEQVGKELFSRINSHIYIKKHKIRLATYMKVAASITIIAVAGWWYLKKDKINDPVAMNYNERLGENIDPGNNKAILILSDGSELNLEGSVSGTLADQGGVAISKLPSGEIVYNINSKVAQVEKSLYNTINIPRGGEYQLVLPDGTKVWLNASSSLKFPTYFTGSSRVVELKGEAYFEVANTYLNKNGKQQRMPFIVKTASQKIEVLGTHFNVNAYANEENVKTTLLEGVVKILSAKTGAFKILKPGQQSQVAAAGNISLTEVDVEEVTAWKNGMFYFNNTDLKTIMKQLSRWYDIEADIENMPQKRFNGILSRNVKLSQVLTMMEKTSGLKFKVEERRVSMLK
ncbi:FecR family protein [Pseudopedobacter beijingensis]|uniref:FecR family protein n=1 Tax=Pseudopedobacter beijingensis TaxID=1207056 RepID=A0ABW4ICR2_9SPHI